MIDDLRRMRRFTSDTLADALRIAGDGASETHVRDVWLSLVGQGWYSPPPGGIILVAGEPPLYERMNQPTFRPPDAWPAPGVYLNDDRLLYAYASPVDTQTGIIGDLGCSLYRGGDTLLREHLREVWRVTMAIIDEVAIGMSFPQLYERAQVIIADAGLVNIVHSVHAGSSTDIGHVIPWSQGPPSAKEIEMLQSGDDQRVADLVSNKRRFINATDNFTITDNVAFTIEPRLRTDDRPMVGFHTVVAFERGQKHVVLEFDPLFELFEMDYL